MTRVIERYRFLVLRRTSQVSIVLLFFAGNVLGWEVLRGDLSSSRVFDTVTLADPFALLQIAAAGRSVAFQAVLGALIVTFFFGIIGGRGFCGWVCPMNMVTDAANRLRQGSRIGAAINEWHISRNARYWIAVLSLVISAVAGVAAFEWISPVAMLHRGIVYGMGWGWAVISAVFIFDLLILKNGFCGHLCPLGAFYSLIGRFSIFRVEHKREKCTACMKCLDVCPEKQVLNMIGRESSMVLAGECTNCGRCIEVCGSGAMRFAGKLRHWRQGGEG